MFWSTQHPAQLDALHPSSVKKQAPLPQEAFGPVHTRHSTPYIPHAVTDVSMAPTHVLPCQQPSQEASGWPIGLSSDASDGGFVEESGPPEGPESGCSVASMGTVESAGVGPSIGLVESGASIASAEVVASDDPLESSPRGPSAIAPSPRARLASAPVSSVALA
jgi:hypothetical protein